MYNAYRWKDGKCQMPQDATIRMLIVLLWDALGIAKATDLSAVDWDTRDVQWRYGRETRMRNGDVLNPLWLPHTTPAVRDYLLARGIDPFTKPASPPPQGVRPLRAQAPIVSDATDHNRSPRLPARQRWTCVLAGATGSPAPARRRGDRRGTSRADSQDVTEGERAGAARQARPWSRGASSAARSPERSRTPATRR